MNHENYAAFIKSDQAIKNMRIAGRLTADVLSMIAQHVNPGISTDTLNTLCHQAIIDAGAKPAPLGYHGFPKSICTSINHVICHGIPSDKKLKDGDIIGIDVSLSKDGYFGDSCQTFIVGKPKKVAENLVNVAEQCLYIAIDMVKPGVNLKSIGRAIAQHAQSNFCSVVREFCGHGIGTVLHEKGFQVLHYDDDHVDDFILHPGMTFTIEPMINAGKPHCKVLRDGWTAVTRDRSLSAQFEHTLLVTKTGAEVLTQRIGESICPP